MGEEFGKMEKLRVLASLKDSPSPLPRLLSLPYWMESSKTSFQAEMFSHTARLDLRVRPVSWENQIYQG